MATVAIISAMGGFKQPEDTLPPESVVKVAENSDAKTIGRRGQDPTVRRQGDFPRWR